jgi:hypothetical protein
MRHPGCALFNLFSPEPKNAHNWLKTNLRYIGAKTRAGRAFNGILAQCNGILGRVGRRKCQSPHADMNETGISHFNQARVEWDIRLQFSPMPRLDFNVVSSNLNAFRIGDHRLAGKMFDIMMQLDGELAVNADKRCADLAALDWSVVSDGSPDGDKHAAALDYFYRHLSVTKALHQDAVGGMPDLLYQIASAHSHLYSAHEMLLRVDNPAAKEVTAEFRHTPIWFFETRRGYMAYLQHIFDVYGQPCMSGEWLTCVGAGWMRPLSVAYTFKQFSMRDWAIFSTRSGSGILEGITAAQKGDPSWEEAKDFLQSIANDGAGLHNREIEFKYLTNPAAANLPMPGIVELVNGLYAKCYRGVELATGSRGAAGKGDGAAKNPVGASVMSEESGILLQHDAGWASGILQHRVDAPIIRYLFNQEPRARLVVSTPTSDTSADDVANLRVLVGLGLPISLKEAYEISGFTPPAAGDPILSAPAPMPENETDPASPAPPAPDSKPGPDPSAEQTQQARPEEPIASGARPNSMAQIPDPAMPDPQVDASGFWDNAARFFVGARAAVNRAFTLSPGQQAASPTAAYAIPNDVAPALSEDFTGAAGEAYAAALRQDMAHAAAEVTAFLEILESDPEHAQKLAPAFLEKWKITTGNTLLTPSSADTLASIAGTAFLDGVPSVNKK